MPCDLAVQPAAKEKKYLASPIRVDHQVLPLNDCPAWLVPRRRASCAPELEQVPKNSLRIFDKDPLQDIDFERFLVDQMPPCLDKRSDCFLALDRRQRQWNPVSP
jgi:hypothetical protein